MGYYKRMKNKCRILSVFVIAVCLIAAVASIIVIKNKQDKTVVYAKSINFVGLVGGAELYINNDLLIGEDLITVSPSNCTVKPQFEIKKSGDDNYQSIAAGKYSFEKEGKYILVCKALKNKNYYVQDKITINVVDRPQTTTSMYIMSQGNTTIYEEDTIFIDDIAEIVAPSGADIDMVCSENIILNNGLVTALNAGYATVEVIIKNDNIIISKIIPIIVKSKIVASEIQLQLSVGANILTSNEIEISLSKFNYAIAYKLLKTDKQLINCWTDSNVVEVVSFNPMTIELKTITAGTATIYVSPLDYPDTIFEFVVRIV